MQFESFYEVVMKKEIRINRDHIQALTESDDETTTAIWVTGGYCWYVKGDNLEIMDRLGHEFK